MMYLLKKMIFSSSVSSILSFLKKERQALVRSVEKPPRRAMMLVANFLISSVRSSLECNFSASMV